MEERTFKEVEKTVRINEKEIEDLKRNLHREVRDIKDRIEKALIPANVLTDCKSCGITIYRPEAFRGHDTVEIRQKYSYNKTMEEVVVEQYYCPKHSINREEYGEVEKT